jgi:hypothetical protein
MKKEYYIPLAIIFGTIIIGVSIYLATTLEYRDKKAMCDEIWGKKGNENTRELLIQVCIEKGLLINK